MDVNMLRVVKLSYKQGFQSQWHTHNYFHCILTIAGTGLVKVSDMEYFVKKDDLILISPRTYHMIASVERYSFKTIETKFSIPDEVLLSQVYRLPVHMCVEGQWMRRPLEQILKEGIEKPLYYKHMINSKIGEVLLILLRANNTGNWKKTVDENIELDEDNSNLNIVIKYIQENIQENITIDDLASVATLSKSYFCTLFKQKYGISPTQYIIKLKLDKAKEFIDGYFERYPGIKKYLDGLIDEARENGFVTTILGRRRYIPEINSRNYNIRQFGERAATNAPVQGSAADIIKLAMIAIHRETAGTGIRMLLQVHDELVFESPINQAEEARLLITRLMENAFPLSVPLEVVTGIGCDWFSCK